MRGTMLTGTLVVATVLIAGCFANPVKKYPQPVPAPLHSTHPSARLFDDTIIVKYKETVLNLNDPDHRKAKMNDIAAGFSNVPGLSGLTAIRTMPILGIQNFKLGQSQSLNTVILLLRKHPSVQYAEYNFRVVASQPHPPKDPDDPQWSAACEPTMPCSFWGLKKIGMRSAWGFQTDASSITVAILDSGIDYMHPDLESNMWTDPVTPDSHGYNFCSHTKYPLDIFGHGTQVAGIIGARGNNNYGAVGADWQVKLLALKMLCINGEKVPMGSLAIAEEAIEDAISRDVPIINNSWRVLPPVNHTDIQSLEFAVRRTNCESMNNIVANCKPALFVASAGNGIYPESLNSDDSGCSDPLHPENCGRVFPASYGAGPYNVANVISVGATICPNPPGCAGPVSNTLWYNSHYGNTTVHIAAPGDDIDTTTLSQEGNGYTVFVGTSAAAAHVSGCAALLQARNLSLKSTLLPIADIKKLLFDNAETPFMGFIIGGRSLNCAQAIAAIP